MGQSKKEGKYYFNHLNFLGIRGSNFSKNLKIQLLNRIGKNYLLCNAGGGPVTYFIQDMRIRCTSDSWSLHWIMAFEESARNYHINSSAWRYCKIIRLNWSLRRSYLPQSLESTMSVRPPWFHNNPMHSCTLGDNSSIKCDFMNKVLKNIEKIVKNRAKTALRR